MRYFNDMKIHCRMPGMHLDSMRPWQARASQRTALSLKLDIEKAHPALVETKVTENFGSMWQQLPSSFQKSSEYIPSGEEIQKPSSYAGRRKYFQAILVVCESEVPRGKDNRMTFGKRKDARVRISTYKRALRSSHLLRIMLSSSP